MIYLIGNTQKEVCKIGYSAAPEKRLAQLQTGCPFSLELLAVQEGSFTEERILHNMLKNEKLEGEWFNLTTTVTDMFNIQLLSFNEWVLKKAAECNGLELKVFLFLIQVSSNNHFVQMNKEIKEEVARLFNTTLPTLGNALTSLVKKGIVKRSSHSVYHL